MMFEPSLKYGSLPSERLGNIFIIDCNKNGSINYCTSILKYHLFYITAPTLLYSYIPLYNNLDKKLRIVFNDNYRNLSGIAQKRIAPMAFPKKAIPVIVTIDDGEVYKSTITKTPNIFLLSGASFSVSENKIIFVGIDNKKLVSTGLCTF